MRGNREDDAVSQQVVQTLAQIRLLLDDLVDTQPLTGLPNRRAMDREVAAGSRGVPMAFAAIEINGFKNINSSYGHAGGDMVLKGLADRLHMCVGAQGGFVAYHLSGDEFAVLGRGCDKRDGLAAMAADWKAELEGAPYAVPGQAETAPGEVTVCICLALAHAEAAPSEIESIRADLDALTELQKWTGRQNAILALWQDGITDELAAFKQDMQSMARRRVRCDECGCYGYLNLRPGFAGCQRGCRLLSDVQ